MAMFNFFFDRKYPFWGNLVPKFKINCLKWNLVPRLIQICRIQWFVQFCSFWPEMSVWANLLQQIKIFSLRWNLVLRLIWICGIQWWGPLFLLSTANTKRKQKKKMIGKSKVFGPDCIPVVVLKNCEPELSYILAELFTCLKESYFPDCWKVSSVVAVFKYTWGKVYCYKLPHC